MIDRQPRSQVERPWERGWSIASVDQQTRLVSSIIISITDDSARGWVRHTTSGVANCSKYVLSNSICNHGFAMFFPFMDKRQRWSACKTAATAERASGDWLGLVNCMKFWANHVAYWRKLIAFRHLNENRSITYHYILDCLQTHVVPCSSSDICCPYQLRRIERAKKNCLPSEMWLSRSIPRWIVGKCVYCWNNNPVSMTAL